VGSTEQELREATDISSFRLDAASSDVRFKVMKMGFWPVRGRFRSMEGRLELDAEGRPVAAELTIDAASLSTRMPPRDAHLRSRQFLDVKRYPAIHFEADEFIPTQSGEHRLFGTLTIRGSSRRVPLHAQIEQHGDHVHVRVTATLDRHDFGIRPPQPFELIVGNLAALDLELVAARAS
jgi:polyisoprenoid-binding protein YceI